MNDLLPDTLRVVAETSSAREANGWEVLLAATGIPHRVVDREEEASGLEEDDGHERYCLIVSDVDRDRAAALLDAHREEEEKRLAKERARRVWSQAAPARVQPAIAATLGLCVVLLIIHLRSPGFDADLSRRMQVDATRMWQHGEWLRTITAVFFHADAGHLFSNLGFLLPLGYFLAERAGPGVLVAGFVATGALANVVSVLVHGVPFHSLGASGGVFGVLGLLVGRALGDVELRDDPERRRRELIGSALAVVGFTAFAEKSDMVAHLAGAFVGIGLGLLVRRRPHAWLDLLLLLGGVLLAAWAFASLAGLV